MQEKEFKKHHFKNKYNNNKLVNIMKKMTK